MSTATFGIVIEGTRPKDDGNCAICLRVTHNRDSKRYRFKKTPTCSGALTIGQFADVMGKEREILNLHEPKLDRATLRAFKDRIREVETKAKNIITKLGDDFTFLQFEDKYFDTGLQTIRIKGTVSEAYKSFIERAKEERRVSTSLSFQCANASLKEFTTHLGKHYDSLSFGDITAAWLRKYEQWMNDNGKSYNTISIYLRTLRQLYLAAIDEKQVSKLSYPFGKETEGSKDKYQIPENFNHKRAIDREDIKKIINYPAQPGTGEEYARDMWIFSYLCNGANMKDIFQLKYSNIDFHNNEITFLRAKTVKGRKKKDIVAVLLPLSKKIIERHGNEEKSKNAYVFPVLSKIFKTHMVENGETIESIAKKYKLSESELKQLNQLNDEPIRIGMRLKVSDGTKPLASQIHWKLKAETKYINSHLKTIAEEIKLKGIELTTMTARHSYATKLMQDGIPVSFISQGLGHSSITTTENYLGRFPKKDTEEYAKSLLDFGE